MIESIQYKCSSCNKLFYYTIDTDRRYSNFEVSPNCPYCKSIYSTKYIKKSFFDIIKELVIK